MLFFLSLSLALSVFFFFLLFIHQRILKKVSGSKKNIKQQKPFPTLIINQNIILISEGSCDTEDWSNDAENSTLITEISFKLK